MVIITPLPYLSRSAVKLCNKMLKAIGALEYFMLREWTFHTHKTRGLWNALSPADQQQFHFDVRELDWGAYITDYQRGCKQFIMREDMKDIETARKNMARLKWVHRLVQLAMMYGVWLMLSSDGASACYSAFFSGLQYLLSMAPALVAVEDAAAAAVGAAAGDTVAASSGS